MRGSNEQFNVISRYLPEKNVVEQTAKLKCIIRQRCLFLNPFTQLLRDNVGALFVSRLSKLLMHK